MVLPRCLSSPGVSTLINLCAIFFLVVNLVQNQFAFHERAVGEHATMAISPGDHPTLLRRRTGGGGDDDGAEVDVDRGVGPDTAPSAIGVAILRSKAVALPSVRVSEAEEKVIDRSIYGGVGDKPHLGGFTEFDVSILDECMQTNCVDSCTDLLGSYFPRAMYPQTAVRSLSIAVETHGKYIRRGYRDLQPTNRQNHFFPLCERRSPIWESNPCST